MTVLRNSPATRSASCSMKKENTRLNEQSQRCGCSSLYIRIPAAGVSRLNWARRVPLGYPPCSKVGTLGVPSMLQSGYPWGTLHAPSGYPWGTLLLFTAQPMPDQAVSFRCFQTTRFVHGACICAASWYPVCALTPRR